MRSMVLTVQVKYWALLSSLCSMMQIPPLLHLKVPLARNGMLQGLSMGWVCAGTAGACWFGHHAMEVVRYEKVGDKERRSRV